MNNNTNLNQMALYKEEQKKKHQAHIKKLDLQKKIIDLLKDKSNNPPNVIQNFARKYVLRETLNDLQKQNIPGLYIKRFPISEFNFFDHAIQDQIEANIKKERDDTYNKIISEATADISDEVIKKAIIESLNINGDILENEAYNSVKETIYWIQIDLQIYGTHPELPYYVEETGNTVYFTASQQKELKNIWNNINQSTSRGIRYKQMLDCSKSLVELYSIKL